MQQNGFSLATREKVGTSHVWFLPMDEIPGGNLPVILYYSFSEERVYFLSIEETLYPPRE
jgi:hypothetical protein